MDNLIADYRQTKQQQRRKTLGRQFQWLSYLSNNCYDPVYITVTLFVFLFSFFVVGIQQSAAASSSPPANRTEKERKELSKNITKILDNIVDSKQYDKRLRPNYGGRPVDVGITLYVSSISAVSEVEMDFTLDFYLRQMWTDPRLGFREKYGLDQDLTVGVEYLQDIWVPDTFFPNEKKSFFHKATTHNSFLRIRSNGEVKTSQRFTAQIAFYANLFLLLSCGMKLYAVTLEVRDHSHGQLSNATAIISFGFSKMYPGNRILLVYVDKSSAMFLHSMHGYTKNEINLHWAYENRPPSVQDVMDKKIELPQFKHNAINPYTNASIISLSSGPYSRLSVCFWFIRSIGFYMIQIYVPAILIVIISWVSFWLSRDAAPARVSLGVTTVLTMTTLMTTTNSQLPKVSYIKSIDLYLGTCFVMVFASLLEYAWVGYTNKKMKMKKESRHRKEKVGAASLPVEYSIPSIPSPTLFRKRMDGGNNMMSPLLNQAHAQIAGGGYHYHQHSQQLHSGHPLAISSSLIPVECDCDIPLNNKPNMSNVLLRIKTPRSRRIRGLTPSMIDKWSRIIFPCIFIAFNATYWGVFYYVKSQYKLQAEQSKIDSDILMTKLNLHHPSPTGATESPAATLAP